ncbi:MAG: hypothetical protein IIB35_10885 [Gemmatimonadetes bacterium]|nr:hypothetical protein [Gemmatimonadota bacterium]
MRAANVLLVGVVGWTGLGFADVVPSGLPAQAGPTMVSVTCVGGNVQISVNPWAMQVQQGSDGEWELSNTSGSQSIVIAPKRQGPANWPFRAMRPGGKGPNDRARGSNMRPNQAGRRFAYNITLECEDAGNTYTVVIDPDIIITPGP